MKTMSELQKPLEQMTLEELQAYSTMILTESIDIFQAINDEFKKRSNKKD